MNNTSLRAGIIGCGGIALAHARGYISNEIKITALADINPERTTALAESAEIKDCRSFDSAAALLDSGLVDMVSICSPPAFHAETAIAALERNINVLVEKPLANTIDASKSIAAAAEKSQALCMTAFRHRFIPAIKEIKKMLDAGRIGPVVFMENIFCGPAFHQQHTWFTKKAVAGGGSMLDTSSHSVDLFRFLIGEVTEQHAVMHTHFTDTDVEDAAILTLKADNGALGTLTSGFVAGDGIAYIDLIGQNGRIYFDYTKLDEIRFKERDSEEWEVIPVERSYGFDKQIAHFAAAVSGREPLKCTVHDGVRAMEIICSNY